MLCGKLRRSSCARGSSEELVSLAGSIGKRPHGSSRDRATLEAGGTGMGQRSWPPAESVLSNTEKPHSVPLILLVPFLPWDGSLSPQRHCVILRRGVAEVGRMGHGLEAVGRAGLRR